MSREAMKQALEAFDALYMNDYSGYEISKHETHIIDDAVKALRQALETEQEPVAWMHTTGTGHVYFRKKPQDKVFNPQPVYTVPPKKQWVGLTDDDVIYFRSQATFCDEFDAAFMAELIEKDLKEKNHG
jgi:hypothetical protein